MPMAMVGQDWCPPDSPFCTCTGDDDCNDMFSTDVCGPSAICQIKGDIPKCRCKKAPVNGRTRVILR